MQNVFFFLTLKLAALEGIKRMINAVDLHWKQEMFLSMLAWFFSFVQLSPWKKSMFVCLPLCVGSAGQEPGGQL